MFRKSSIQKITFLSFLVIIFVFTICLSGGWLYETYRHSALDSSSYEDEYLRDRQWMLRNEVGKIIQLIDFQRKQKEKEIRDTLRERVLQAYTTALHTYQKNQEKLPVPEIKQLIIATLRASRFDNGQGYYFATTGDGGEEIIAARPELAGRKLTNVTDSSSAAKVRSMVAMVSAHEEAFYQYLVPDPQDTAQNRTKLAFIKYFEPFGWYIGTAAYKDDMTRDVQKNILDYLYSMQQNIGTIALFREDGIALFHSRKENIGRNMFSYTDDKGMEIYRQLLHVALNAEGGFVSSAWEDAATLEMAPKIAYARSYPDWQWIVAIDVNTDDIRGALQQKKRLLKQQVNSYIIKGLVLLVGFVVFVIFLSHYLAGRLNKEFQAFTAFFQGAASGYSEIDRKSLNIREFRNLAESANRMIRDRRKHEEEMLRLRAMLSSIINSMPSILVGVDQDGKVIQWNREAEKQTGISSSAALGCLLSEVLPQLAGQKENIRQALAKRQPKNPTRVFDLQDGKPHYADIVVYPLIGEAVSGAVIRIDDVTEQVFAEMENTNLLTQLQHSQKMEAIGTLASGIAHDFNNILTPILGYADMIKNETPQESHVFAYLNAVLSAGNRAKDLVTQILAFSRQREQDRQPVQIHLIVKEALKLLRASIPTTIEIRTDIAPDCCQVLADPSQIHQIVMNLCTNSYHAMRATGGVLAIGLTPIDIRQEDSKDISPELVPGPYVHLEISDTGHGMDLMTLERIFEPYFTTKKEGEGTGLGLSVVHNIVKSHDGHITVASELGKGTTFHVYLPRLLQAGAPVVQATESLPTGNERVLLVDDEEVITRMEELMLTDLGYAVTALMDSVKALETFKARPHDFDLIITDMTMPRLTGLELTSEILAIRPDIPIIMCTGFSELVNEEQAKAQGIREFLMKPVMKRDMAKAMRQALDSKQRA
ncbi:MAG: cache domain-containing protein [Proteobacteria bacterium]|nr:cache domain-containing protein [Pseudomonadota bacterium]